MTMAAIPELRERASSGDAESQLALGTRLMTGKGVAPDHAEGADLVTRAAEQGNADAVALLAVVEAMGAGRPQSWNRAFDRLQEAAELGCRSAQSQLILLNRDPSLGAEAESGAVAGDLWERLRAGLDIAVLTTTPPKKSLSDAPRIRIVEGFASTAECDWAMERTKAGLRPAMVVDPRTGLDTSHPDRTNRDIELGLAEMDLVLQVLRARIASVTNLPVPVFEPAHVMHYSVGQEFRPHFDFLTEDAEGWAAQLHRYGQRIATFLLYLNDDFEGGETDFPKAGISHRGHKGDALFFANVDPAGLPDRLTLHAGQAPTRGEKWILSQWIRDRTPGPPPA